MGEKRKEIKNLRFLGRRFFEVVDGLPFKQFFSGERFTVLRDGQGVAAFREGFQSADDQPGESLCVVLPLEDGGAEVTPADENSLVGLDGHNAPAYLLLLGLPGDSRCYRHCEGV